MSIFFCCFSITFKSSRCFILAFVYKRKEKIWIHAQQLEIRWWKRYLANKNPTQYHAWKTSYWLRILKSIEHLLPENADSALDVACGPAGIFLVLHDKQVTAVDPLIADYEKYSFLKVADYPNVHFETLAFEDFVSNKMYPLVFAMNAINHFKDIDKAVKKLIQLTATNGRLILSIDTHRIKLLKYLLRWIKIDRMHPWQFSADEYRNMFQGNGMELKHESVINSGLVFQHRLMVFSKNKTITTP